MTEPTKYTPAQTAFMTATTARLHRQKILTALTQLGAEWYDMQLPETHLLPQLIHLDEQILGVVYGRYHQENGVKVGRGVLVATNDRVLLVDKKPLFLRCDEFSYFVVSGVTYSKAGIAGTVVLHTRVGDIHVRTFNQRCAQKFVVAIEEQVLAKGVPATISNRGLAS